MKNARGARGWVGGGYCGCIHKAVINNIPIGEHGLPVWPAECFGRPSWIFQPDYETVYVEIALVRKMCVGLQFA